MEGAVRAYVTAGLALVGAGIIAVPPGLAPSPELKVTEIHLAAADGITAYVDLFGDTFGNLSRIGGELVSNPVPILTQIATNQLGAWTNVVDGLQTSVTGLADYVTGDTPNSLVPLLQSAFDTILDGNIANGFSDAFNAALLAPALQLAGLLQPLNAAIEMPFTHLASAVSAALQRVLIIGLGVIAPPAGLVHASGAVLDNLVASASNPLEFGQELLGAPALIANTLINAFPDAPGTYPGLLAPGFGLVEGLLGFRDGIANAIEVPGFGSAGLVDTVASMVGDLFNGSGFALSDLPQDLFGALGAFDPTQLLGLGDIGSLLGSLPFIGDIVTALLTSF